MTERVISNRKLGTKESKITTGELKWLLESVFGNKHASYSFLLRNLNIIIIFKIQ